MGYIIWPCSLYRAILTTGPSYLTKCTLCTGSNVMGRLAALLVLKMVMVGKGTRTLLDVGGVGTDGP